MAEVSRKFLRKEALLKRNQLNVSERNIKDNTIAQFLFLTDEYRRAKTLLLYCSYNGEVDTYGIFKQAIKDNKVVAFPKSSIIDDVPTMSFYLCNAIEDLKTGYKGIQEPDDSMTLLNSIDFDNTLIIIPIVAFDDDKNRLGYGMGFYDRFLTANRFNNIIALAYTCQRVNNINAERYDIKPTMIITEDGII